LSEKAKSEGIVIQSSPAKIRKASNAAKGSLSKRLKNSKNTHK